MDTAEHPQPKIERPLSKLQARITLPFFVAALTLSGGGTLAALVIFGIGGELPSNWLLITAGLFAALLALSVVIALTVGYLVTSPMARRLHLITRVVEAMAAGDLSQRTGMEANDEIGALGRGLDTAAGRQLAYIRKLEINMRTGEQAIAQLGSMLQHVPDGIIMLDKRARVSVMNQAAHEMFGSENGFWESEFAAFIDFLDAGRPLAAQLKSPARRQGNLDQRTLEAQAAVVHSEDGEELGIVLSFRDVTHTARALDLKDNFIAKQAQQMRIPLLKMKLAGERLHQLAPAHPIVKAVRENTRLMRAITGQALDVAEMIEGNFAIRQDPVTLEPLLSEVLRTHTPSFQDAGIELRTMMLDRHLDVSGDVRRLRVALDHLLDNARAYTPAGGTVTVSMSAMIMGYAAIDITDTGIGIPSEDIPDIFEPYQRGSNLGALNGRRSALDGLGLGLFIVQHIAQAHGGKLTVSSTPNEGSTFSLVLPLSPH